MDPRSIIRLSTYLQLRLLLVGLVFLQQKPEVVPSGTGPGLDDVEAGATDLGQEDLLLVAVNVGEIDITNVPAVDHGISVSRDDRVRASNGPTVRLETV